MFWGFGGLKACRILVHNQGLNSLNWKLSPNQEFWKVAFLESGGLGQKEEEPVSQEWNRFDKEKGPSERGEAAEATARKC